MEMERLTIFVPPRSGETATTELNLKRKSVENLGDGSTLFTIKGRKIFDYSGTQIYETRPTWSKMLLIDIRTRSPIATVGLAGFFVRKGKIWRGTDKKSATWLEATGNIERYDYEVKDMQTGSRVAWLERRREENNKPSSLLGRIFEKKIVVLHVEANVNVPLLAAIVITFNKILGDNSAAGAAANTSAASTAAGAF